MNYDFNGVSVPVSPGERIIVVTSEFGDCVSRFLDSAKIESQIDRGIWDDSFVYRVTYEKGVELINQPMSHGDYID